MSFSTRPLFNKETNLSVITLIDASYSMEPDKDWETKKKLETSSGIITVYFTCPSTRRGSTFPLTLKIKGEKAPDAPDNADNVHFEFMTFKQDQALNPGVTKITKRHKETQMLIDLGVLDENFLVKEDAEGYVEVLSIEGAELADKLNALKGKKFQAKIVQNNYGWNFDPSKITLVK
jgi:hypothetical protein